MERSFAWSVAVVVLPLLVTAVLTGAYLRSMFRYRAAVDEAATEVAGVLLRDMFDVVFARAGRAASDLFREPFVLARGAPGPSPAGEDRIAEVLGRVADSLAACACGALPTRGTAVFTPLTGTLAVRGGVEGATWRRRLADLTLTDTTRYGRLVTAAGQDGEDPWFLYLIVATPEGAPPAVLLADVDLDRMGPDLIEPAFTLVAETHDLTRASGPSGLALRVTHPQGRVIFDAGRPSDGPTYVLPLFSADLGSTNVRGTRPLLARITLHPDAIPGIIPGGLPGSPWPLAVASVLVALALTGVGVALLFRLRRFTLARERFIATVSHELRTPLSLLLAYSETVGLDRPTPESRRRAATVITRETRRMIHMVENALAFGRGQGSTATLDPRPADLAVAVGEIVADFRPLAEDREARLTMAARGPVPVRVDGPALRQMVNNLLDNAVRHGPAGQEVTIAVEPASGWAEIRVSDQGPGLPPGAGARLWKPFVQLDGTAAGQGTGLGLSIVRQLAELHDGSAHAANRPDVGAVFTVRLPLATAGEEPSWPAS